MEATGFKESNVVLDKPPGMTDDDCYSLSVFRGVNTNGIPIVISCWKLSQEELEEFNKTKRIYLMVCGQSMPPVALMAKSPFKEENV